MLRTALAIEALASVFVVAAGLTACGAEATIAVAETDALVWDFEDGQDGGWTGHNSEAQVSDERGRGGSHRSLRVDPGQWGANFTLESPQLARCLDADSLHLVRPG